MSDWSEPHETDAGLAEAYRKRPQGCICEVEVVELRGGASFLLRRDYELVYDRRCPTHFPETLRATQGGS